MVVNLGPGVVLSGGSFLADGGFAGGEPVGVGAGSLSFTALLRQGGGGLSPPLKSTAPHGRQGVRIRLPLTGFPTARDRTVKRPSIWCSIEMAS